MNINDNKIAMHIWLTGIKPVFFNSNLQLQHQSLTIYIVLFITPYFSCESIDVFLLFFFLCFIHNVPAQPPYEIFVVYNSAIHQLFNWHSATLIREQLQNFFSYIFLKIFWVDRSMNLFIPFPLITIILNYIFP